MHESDRQTRSHLVELFAQQGFHPRHDLGQNFLIDLNLIEFVVREAELDMDDVVLEIGAGTGGMTTFLAREAGAVVSVEIDPNMYALASEATASYRRVTLLNCDALKSKNTLAPEVLAAVAERRAELPEGNFKLVANLPYSVATPVVSNLVATELPWERMVITIQYELAERMVAEPGSDAYGALSVWLQSQCEVKIRKKLGPNVFWPRPKVDSAIVKITRDDALRSTIDDRAFFHEFIRGLFSQRRKVLRGTLAGLYRNQLKKPEVDAILAEEGLVATTRAEEMTPVQLVQLSNRFRKAIPVET
jgi:16S rRNA (adenine1518-N6/adenine1519-N6)-dimethyltransferase